MDEHSLEPVHGNYAKADASPYSPLGPDDIRLVKVMPGDIDDPVSFSIDTVNLRARPRPRYEALSYVWTPKDGTIDALSRSHHIPAQNYPRFPLEVKANLHAAMRHIRLPTKSRALWIDALCM
jgi:hypothetical protein